MSKKDIKDPQVVKPEDNEGGEGVVENKDNESNDISGVVNEIKEMRKENRELKDLINLKETVEDNKVTEVDEVDEVDKKIQDALNKERSKEAEQNKKIAFEQFYGQNKEFHPDNDSSGLKKAYLEKELKNFNLSNSQSVEDFVSVLNKAKRLISESKDNSTVIKPDAITEIGGSTGSQEGNLPELTAREKQAIEQAEWTKEKYFKMKEKYPEIIETLLN